MGLLTGVLSGMNEREIRALVGSRESGEFALITGQESSDGGVLDTTVALDLAGVDEENLPVEMNVLSQYVCEIATANPEDLILDGLL